MSPVLLVSFIACIAGAYSRKMIANYVYGQNQCLLYAVDLIIGILCHLDLTIQLHATVYSSGRVGEFTVKTLTAFVPAKHVKPADVADTVDRNGLEMSEFDLPTTKSVPQGEKVSWAEQDGPTNPKAALKNHISVNDLPAGSLLFVYKDSKNLTKHKPLTKSKFLQALTAAIKQYLLHGVPFDIMKTNGCWASTVFETLAPYMQANPEIHTPFVSYKMPCVC
ncbi:hypothetical protein DFH08DRAFT_1015020 [Mycena albidolilacea]|uniref:Uncharacterized protein n=1 Tax=Mycena albidolilacea TaxID=1033008 RepID=A0AAD6ZTE3_9AGAR|nr:hypothetical protein DFH08DRAFT_1015020 [Mycena albidolilacea]